MLVALLGCLSISAAVAWAVPYIPARDDEELATVPAGATHSSALLRQRSSATRPDVALLLAQFYLTQARASGDLRYLGYAEATLQPWIGGGALQPAALTLEATVLQSRHDFTAALVVLGQAIALRPADPQSWLTRATVERVLGRYEQALASCARITAAASLVANVCTQSVRGLMGQLEQSRAAMLSIPTQQLSNEAQAWRISELGDMEVRLGHSSQAEADYRAALRVSPSDAYSKTAYADVLLDEHRARDALELLKHGASIEPMLLRIALAEQQLGDARLQDARARLASAFAVEEQRGEAVHRREQARFLLDIEHDPGAALRAALADWQVQREPADALIVLRAAAAAHHPDAAREVRAFLQHSATEDVRLKPFLMDTP